MPMVMQAGKTVMPETNILTEKYTHTDVVLHKNSETLTFRQTALSSSGNTLTFNTNKYAYWQPR